VHTYFDAKKAGYYFTAKLEPQKPCLNIIAFRRLKLTFLVTGSLNWSITFVINNEK